MMLELARYKPKTVSHMQLANAIAKGIANASTRITMHACKHLHCLDLKQMQMQAKHKEMGSSSIHLALAAAFVFLEQ